MPHHAYVKKGNTSIPQPFPEIKEEDLHMHGTYFNTCPNCGAHLDPGERCDCETRTDEEREEKAA